MATCNRADGVKPSVRLADFLEGRTPLAECDPVTLSWAEFIIYKKAEELVKGRDPERVKRALAQADPQLEPFLRRECRRLWGGGLTG